MQLIKVFRVLFFLLLSVQLFAQEIDTTQVFTLDQYLTWVRTYHPVIQQSALLQKQADNQLMEARGIFDPKLSGQYEHKSFDQKNYFRIAEAGLKVPLWFGADVKVGYLWSNGNFLNPEANLPQTGQAIVGIDLPLLQGLLFDQRRAQVQQARLFKDANEATRRTIVNQLLLEAINVYWKWAFHQQVLEIYNNALALAEFRFQNVKESFLQGDKPAIDTLESLIQIQNRTLQFSQAKVDFQNATLELSNYLWFEDLVPLEVSEDLRPERLDNYWAPQQLEPDFINSLFQTHPELQSIGIKQQQLDIKEKLKREQFKPDLKFNYNFLANGLDFLNTNTNDNPINYFLTENYKWGATFNYPLFLRKERGGLELVKLEQIENQLKLEEKTLIISNKINAILQQSTTTLQQIVTLSSMVSNYDALLSAENEKFRFGESSIFLINSREQKLIDSQIKLKKLQSEFQKLKWKLDWAKGVLQ